MVDNNLKTEESRNESVTMYYFPNNAIRHHLRLLECCPSSGNYIIHFY